MPARSCSGVRASQDRFAIAQSLSIFEPLGNLIMKAMKRTMAREYSRELGVKVLAGQKRLATMGFKQGGAPGYGLRRMLVSADREAKLMLLSGQRKSISTDRVILIPGSSHEVEVVREIYRPIVTQNLPVYAIARHLNEKGIPLLLRRSLN